MGCSPNLHIHTHTHHFVTKLFTLITLITSQINPWWNHFLCLAYIPFNSALRHRSPGPQTPSPSQIPTRRNRRNFVRYGVSKMKGLVYWVRRSFVSRTALRDNGEFLHNGAVSKLKNTSSLAPTSRRSSWDRLISIDIVKTKTFEMMKCNE